MRSQWPGPAAHSRSIDQRWTPIVRQDQLLVQKMRACNATVPVSHSRDLTESVLPKPYLRLHGSRKSRKSSPCHLPHQKCNSGSPKRRFYEPDILGASSTCGNCLWSDGAGSTAAWTAAAKHAADFPRGSAVSAADDAA